jgi:two-component system sensor histidine kinase/response regulator
MQRRARDLGIDALLQKPISPSTLFDAIVGVFGAQAAQSGGSGRVEDQARAQLRGARILLAEDNEINQQVAQGILEDIGIELVIAPDGRAVLKAIDAAHAGGRPYEAVLMDMQMPEMDGITATRRLREDARNAQLPVIAMTANAMAADREACLAAGMNDHVGKPLNVDHLFTTLMAWIPARDRGALPVPGESPVPAAFTRAGELPALPGVDTELGLARTGGKPVRYLDLLKRFHAGQAQAPMQIEAAANAGDMDLAIRLAHTLRGTAATLGAAALQSIAGELETALKQGHASWRQRLGETQAALQPVIAGIGAHFGSREVVIVADAPRAALPRFDHGVLEALAGQIDSLDSQAAETIESLRAQLGPAAPLVLARIEEHVGNFAFEEAAALMEELRSSLGVGAER